MIPAQSARHELPLAQNRKLLDRMNLIKITGLFKSSWLNNFMFDGTELPGNA